MNFSVLKAGYELAKEFVSYVSLNNKHALLEKFQISNIMFDEIVEVLSDYYDDISVISIPEYEIALDYFENQKDRYDFFDFHEADTWGLDCNLFENGQIDEPVIHFRIRKELDFYYLDYLYIDC